MNNDDDVWPVPLNGYIKMGILKSFFLYIEQKIHFSEKKPGVVLAAASGGFCFSKKYSFFASKKITVTMLK